MANLNLSQFGEKSFVADADHTFIWDSAASISKRVSRNSWLNSGTLTSDAPVTISQTWGTTGTYTAVKVVATETLGAASASNLLEFWSGTTPALKLGIGKGGSILSKVGIITSNGNTNAAGLSLGLLFAGYGLGVDANGNTAFLLNGLAKTRCGFGVAVASDQSIGWTNAAHVGGDASLDTILVRDSSSGNTLALRNGAAAQTFNVYNTYTDASNYSRLRVQTGSGFAQINAEGAGTGLQNSLYFNAGSTSNNGIISFRTKDVERWNIASAGHLLAGIDGQFDIGASGTARPRNVYVGSNIYAAGNVGIGTTAPSQKLEVWGNSGSTISKVTSVSPGTGSILWLDGPLGQLVTSTGNLFITNQSGNSIVFETNSTEKMRLLSNGNLGIGTTSPTSKLHVTGGDVEIETVTSGIIMKAAGTSTRYRITLNAGGTALVFTAI